MTKEDQRRQAETFQSLHRARPMLVLANAWDVVSARIFQLEGFKAVGTTSAGISATLGYPDGQRMSLAETTAVVRRIAERVDLPVSADIEAGYAANTEGVVNSARAVMEAGAVGINLEDGTGDTSSPLYDVSEQVERIGAIRGMAEVAGIPLVINARTDVYLVSGYEPADRLRHAVRRGNAYRQAGADCVFVPDLGDLEQDTIVSLVREIDAPLSVIAGANTPPLAELEQLGVARVSFGPRAMRAALALLKKIARELLDEGTYTTMTADALSYAEVNAMFEPALPGDARR